jgi:hypothetical protein
VQRKTNDEGSEPQTTNYKPQTRIDIYTIFSAQQLLMRFFLLLTLLLLGQPLLSQIHITTCSGSAHKELYDLHVDQKGYLWIAHGLGISRYDGLNFINYSHPSQINLRSTDIVEDRAGRIWFHNFSGQIFYIEKGKNTIPGGL